MATSGTSYCGCCRKYLLWCIVLFFLTFPHASEEFGFKFGNNGDDKSSEPIKQVLTAKQRRPIEHKFKFHKIERIYDDDDGADADAVAATTDEDVDVHGGGARVVGSDNTRHSKKTADQSNKNKRRNRDDDGDDDDDSRERARAARRGTRAQHHNKVMHNSADESADETAADDSSSSLLQRLFGLLFGSNDEQNESTETTAEAEEKSSNLIDWIKWLIEKVSTAKAAEQEHNSAELGTSLLTYFNRWPFNSFFPIGRPDKPIIMPRRSANARPPQYNSQSGEEDDSAAAAADPEPISQEHFESLLHTLPGFVVNPARVADTECRQQMQVFHRQLRGNKLWTLQMLDATAKITPGLLRGNINQFGDFEQCIHVKTMVKVTADIPMRVRGKYCLAHIETQTDVPELKLPLHYAHGRGLWNSHLGNPSHFVARYAVANLGICIPHLCSAKVVQDMIEYNLRPYNTTGVEFHIEVDDDNDCFMRETNKFSKLMRKNGKFCFTVAYITMFLLLLLAGLLYEHNTLIKEAMRILVELLELIKIKTQLIITRIKEIKIKLPFKRKETEEGVEKDSDEAAAEEDDAVTSEISENSIQTTTEAAASVEAVKETETDITAAMDGKGAVEESAEDTKSITKIVIATVKSMLAQVFSCFSPERTFNELMSLEHLDVQFPIFHVLKIGATFMLYTCLKFLMIGHLPITNRDHLVRAVENPLSVVFRAPMIYTDVLLMISGFLVTYQLAEEMEQKNHIHLLKRVVSKALRYLPTLYVVLFFQTWILPKMGSGPIWNSLVGQNARLCEQQMWRNLFSVQNAIDFEETCSPMTIQLGLEVQLYLLGPLIVWLYYTNADVGFFTYGALHAMSVAVRFARTNRELLSTTIFHGMNVSKFYRTANMLYASPISRATPYLLGIGAALVYRSQEGTIDVAPQLIPVGWLITLSCIVWCFWCPASGMRTDFIYNSNEAAAYAAWYPLILSLALCWIIFMLPKGENSVLNYIITSRPIVLLSRIAYPMQLVMYVMVMYNTAIVKETQKFHLTDMINFSEIGLIIILAAILAFLVDVPTQHLRHAFVNRLFIERIAEEPEPPSGTEQSEADVSEEQTDRVTSDTPEPADTIWGSDPEEEEKKYIARRRSSVATQDITAASSGGAETKEVEPDEEEPEDEENEENDITEEDEVKKRPEISVSKDVENEPDVVEKKIEVEEETKPIYRRRRRPISDD